jgi:hypothetical protein
MRAESGCSVKPFQPKKSSPYQVSRRDMSILHSYQKLNKRDQQVVFALIKALLKAS